MDDNNGFESNKGIVLFNAAIEVGFGDTKWAYRNAMGNIVKDSFPSLAPIYQRSSMESSMGVKSKKTFIVSVDNEQFEVGPDVSLATSQNNSGKWLSDDFPASKNYKALVFGAISQMTANHIGHLVLGLPVHTLDKYKDFLREQFVGKFHFSDRDVIISKVSVIAQPIGTLVRCASENLNVQNNSINLIIDPGYYSTDWVVANGFRVITSRSGGKVAGVYPILNAVCKLISEEIGSNFDQVERITHAIKNKTSITILGQQFSYDKIWSYVEQCDSIIDDCLNEILNKIGTINDLDSIVLTGGGSVFYQKSCEKRFSPIPINTLNQPSFANVIGYLLAGENKK